MNRQERFPVSLAIVDTIPVVLFSAAVSVLSGKLHSFVFLIGALICILSGGGKILWKLINAINGKDIHILGAQLRYLMPSGFILMGIGAAHSQQDTLHSLLNAAIHPPAVFFFALAILGLVLMVVCARRFDRRDLKGNWMEQGFNILAQGCVLVGVLLLS